LQLTRTVAEALIGSVTAAVDLVLVIHLPVGSRLLSEELATAAP
jgi:hypothetical protein